MAGTKLLYLAFEEPDWDGLNAPTYPKIYGIFTSLDRVIEYLVKQPKEGNYAKSCYVSLIKKDRELDFCWFSGVWVSGLWNDNDEHSKLSKELAETTLLKIYNANLPS